MEPIQGARIGSTRKNLSGELAYTSFVPARLSGITLERARGLDRAVGAAEFALGRLWAACERMGPEQVRELEREAIAREARSSWKLSAGRDVGIAARTGGGAESSLTGADALDADNLARAISYAADPFDDLPVSRRLLANAHYLMTQGPRYEQSYPGEFRRSPAWIGPAGAALATARFVGPEPAEMETAFADLERYIHADDGESPIVKVALAHLQFELIRPFIDGNGRIGRILSLLMLRDAGRIPALILPISDVLRSRSNMYYASIEFAEFDDDIEGWVAFMAEVIEEAAERAIKNLSK